MRIVKWIVTAIIVMMLIVGCSGELMFRVDPRYDDNYYSHYNYDSYGNQYHDTYYGSYYSDCPRYWLNSPRCDNCHWY